MSAPEEKNLGAPLTSSGRARATLEQLRARYGFDTTKEEEERVQVWSMDGVRESWVRIQGKGLKALFERAE